MTRLVPALLAALLLPLASSATVVVDRPVSDLTRRAALVVRAAVVSSKAGWDEEHRLIITRTELRTTRRLKGDAGRTVIVRQPGGEVDGVRMNVAGAATFRAGEEAVVFLEPHPSAVGEFVLTSMSAAKFTVVTLPGGSERVDRDAEGLVFARRDPASGLVRPGSGGSVVPSSQSWKAFEGAVRAGLVQP